MKAVTGIVSLALVICLLTVAFTGCITGNEPPASTTPGAAVGSNTAENTQSRIEPSEEAHLIGYLLGGPAPAGMGAVLKEFNKKIKASINATTEINYIDWMDWKATYAVILAAGNGVDWIYTADWALYQEQGPKGAFREIKMDEVQKYMPLCAEAIPEEGWTDLKLGGKIYMIPAVRTPGADGMMVLRGDLIKKYNLAMPTGLNDLEPYLKAVKKNEKNMTPIFSNNLDWNGVGGGTLLGHAYVGIYRGGGAGIYYAWDQPELKLFSIFDPEVEQYFIDAAKMSKKWYDAGYINQSFMNSETNSSDAFKAGRSAVAFGNTASLQEAVSIGAANGYDPVILTAIPNYKKVPEGSYAGNGAAITAVSRHPERTMMMLDYMMFDREAHDLVYYGLEGVNYVVKDGKIDLPDGLIAENRNYFGESAGFWFVNHKFDKPSALWPNAYTKLLEELPSWIVPNPAAGFNIMTDNVKTELANVQNVFTTYGDPVQKGMAKDVDAAWATFKQKMMEAGHQKLIDEAQKQVDAFKAGK